MFRVKKILCPTDFSALSRKAVDTAADLAVASKARLTLLHVIEPVPVAVDLATFDVPLYERELARTARRKLERACAALAGRRRRLRVAPVVKLGATAETIVRTARAEKPDLIVIATHGRSGFNRFLFGSVAERVIRLASCPVLIVRSGAKRAK